MKQQDTSTITRNIKKTAMTIPMIDGAESPRELEERAVSVGPKRKHIDVESI